MIIFKIFFTFTFLKTTEFVINSHIWAKIYFALLKMSQTKLEILLIPNLDLSEKIGKTVTKNRKILALFCSLLALILG